MRSIHCVFAFSDTQRFDGPALKFRVLWRKGRFGLNRHAADSSLLLRDHLPSTTHLWWEVRRTSSASPNAAKRTSWKAAGRWWLVGGVPDQAGLKYEACSSRTRGATEK